MDKINFTFIQDEYKINLTDDQKNALDKITNFFNSKDNSLLIEGFAGTGKTTLITLVVSQLIKNKVINSVAFSAPTNKAVNVIIERYPINTKDKNIIIDFLTIHKLLRYKSEYDNDGNKIFVKDSGSCFKSYNVIIIDECSMLSKDIVNDINEEIKSNDKTKVILIGDPAQLPPINEDYSCSFKKFKNKVLLKQVIRSGKKGIVDCCNNTRNSIFDEKEEEIKDYEGLFLYKNNYEKKKMNNLVNNFSEYITKSNWFKKFLNTNDSIILAWTNKQVSLYNEEIRKIKFGSNLKKYLVGDKLILTDYYLTNDDYNEPIYTSEQIEIIGVNECNIKFPEMKCNFENITKTIKNVANRLIDKINNGTIRQYNVYKLKIIKSNNLSFIIYVLKDNDVKINNKDQEFAKDNIYNFVKKYNSNENIEKNVIRILWKFYNKTFVDPFAKINYGYSTTVHKSQASSYKNVFIDSNDILKNGKEKEALRCLYTAQSRAINSLHILL